MSEVGQVLAAVSAGDQSTLKALLHPYLHWSEGDLRLRGRVNVLTHLANRPALPEPASVELRDGQIYRWLGP